MAKFKVGDKVRVRRDLNIGECYSGVVFVKGMNKYKGEIIEIEDIADDDIVFLKDINFAWLDEMLEEVKEDKMEKTFRELIIDGIKPGEIWESKDQRVSRIYLNEYGNLQLEGEDSSFAQNYSTCIGLKATYELKRKEYTFEEAFKAYEEGKEIESCSFRYKKINDEILYINIEKGYKDTLKEVQMFFTLEEIKGKWYIND